MPQRSTTRWFGARPDVVVHQLTAIPARLNVRRIDRDFALTNRLLTEGTDHLIAAARAAGARRLVVQSFTGWPYAREGGPVKDEDDPLDPSPPARLAPILEAIRHHEAAVVGAEGLEGVVLRYGALYGPGTSFSDDGTVTQDVRRRRFPLVGDAGGVWSFVHVEDAAGATVAAVERGAPGIYNVVDETPPPSRSGCPPSRPPWARSGRAAYSHPAGGPPGRPELSHRSFREEYGSAALAAELRGVGHLDRSS